MDARLQKGQYHVFDVHPVFNEFQGSVPQLMYRDLSYIYILYIYIYILYIYIYIYIYIL